MLRDNEGAHTRAETAIIIWNKFREAAGLALEAAPGEPVPQNMEKLFNIGMTAGWIVKTTRVSSPTYVGSGSAVVLSKVSVEENAEVSIEAKRPDTGSQAAMIFGAKNDQDYFILDVTFFGDGTECGAALYAWKAPKLKRLASTRFNLRKVQRSDWLRYVVRIKGKSVTCFVGGKKLFVARCGRAPDGWVGMHVSGASRYKGQVHYRRISVSEFSKAP